MNSGTSTSPAMSITSKDGATLEDFDAAWTDDSENPRNWSLLRKWNSTGEYTDSSKNELRRSIVQSSCRCMPSLGHWLAPALPDIAEHYAILNPTITALTLSVYLLGFAISPLVVGPLSEIYGRQWVLHGSMILFLIFNTACIFAPNVGALIAFRLLAGFGGCTPTSIGAGCLSDVFNERDRAPAYSFFILGPFLGPSVGPVFAGFVTATIGFKYIFVIISALSLISIIYGLLVYRESYAPAIRERHIKQRLRALSDDLENLTKRQRLVAEITYLQGPKADKAQFIIANMTRPIILLTRSFICFILCLYMAVNFGYYYMLFTTFSTVFEGRYSFDSRGVGLTYLGPGIGFVFAAQVGTQIAHRVYRKLCDRNGGVGKPEFRIPGMIPGAICVPVGLFWYGWSAEARVHWIMPIIGSGIFTAGLMFSFLPLLLYLADSFTYAASAASAAATLRSFLAFAFPLFGEQMFEKMGLGGGSSFLAALSIVLGIPFPIWIYYRGEIMRQRNSLNR